MQVHHSGVVDGKSASYTNQVKPVVLYETLSTQAQMCYKEKQCSHPQNHLWFTLKYFQNERIKIYNIVTFWNREIPLTKVQLCMFVNDIKEVKKKKVPRNY